MNLTNITYPILLIAFIIFIAYVIYLLKYLLILNKAINNKKPIITLRPAYPHDPEIKIKTHDFSLQRSFYNSVYVSDTPNEEVDFMEDDDIEKTVKYMREHIKS